MAAIADGVEGTLTLAKLEGIDDDLQPWAATSRMSDVLRVINCLILSIYPCAVPLARTKHHSQERNLSHDQSTVGEYQRASASASTSTNMAASRDDDGLELSTFGQDSSHHGGQQELARKKARVLVASSLLQLPIWGINLFLLGAGAPVGVTMTNG